ncbi:hypothetical protein J2X31_001985 [Flavobacterium arsenatis]|uniref:Yip1 domain-containing protein n=1 Tax=Flavobacterium arsenatis TaxID=1484332 RepID=A0ABU1TPV2_9FLAO|nr:hypothetical protein [Flavobacterium arsenatis]MDR6967971.1 hypothetical protein [Flavobacterium arsenatis]
MKTLLFNPFEKYAENKLLLFGIFITLAGSYLGYLFQGRFDGVIDLHFVPSTTLFEPLADNLINIFSLFLLLFLLGKYINPKTRVIDTLTPVMIARLPFYLLTFFNYQNYISGITEKLIASIDLQNTPTDLNIATSDLIITLLFSGISILFLVWFVILLFNGFKVATNSRGIKNNLLFAGAIILAEILSKIIFTFLN